MTEPGYVPPPRIGWWVKKNMTLFAPNAALTVTGEIPIVSTPSKHLPSAATLALTGATPTVRRGVSLDAVGAASAAGAASVNWSHTITGNAVVVAASYFGASAAPTVSATVGATSMTLLASQTSYISSGGFFASIYLFGLLSPPAGSQTITFNGSGGTALVGNSVSYSNVASFGTAVTNTGVGTAMSLSVSTITPEQLVVQAFGGYIYNFSAYNKTSRYLKQYQAGVNLSFQMGDARGAVGPVSFTGTQTNADGWGAVGVPLNR